MSVDYGPLNGHSVGTLMKEAVRRAIVAIRGHRFTFEVRAKSSPYSVGPDFVTTADQAAQRVFVTLLREWFPSYGIVAEEGQLSVPCTHPTQGLWFTVDPLDGTRAFMRRQSHGIGTMIGLVADGEVIGACVGDVMTQEVYSARPESASVHRVSEFGIAERLGIDPERPLARQWMLVRGGALRASPMARAMVDHGGSRLVMGMETSKGSIGIALARLWKGEVGAAVLGPIPQATPWDIYPIWGISRRLGFIFLTLGASGVTPWEPEMSVNGCPIPSPILVIHASRRAELDAWISQYRAV